MKIRLISSGLGRISRGVETWMLELAQHLPRDMDVELWSGGPAPKINRPSRQMRSIGRDTFFLKPFSWSFRYQFEQLSMLPVTLAAIKKAAPAVVYCGDPALAWHLNKRAGQLGCKVVFMNGMRLGHSWTSHFAGVHLLAPHYLEEAKKEVGPELHGKFFVAPHFVDPNLFKVPTAAEKKEARRELGLPETGPIALNVGPVSRVSGKRLDHILSELAMVPGLHLVSCGVFEDGHEEIKRMAAQLMPNRVSFLGPKPRAMMPKIFQAADLFILAALAEPFSIAVIEALASGMPVMHHPEAMRSWQTGLGGWAVSMEKSGALADLTREVLLSDEIEKKSAAARLQAIKLFSPEIVCRQIVDGLQRVITFSNS